MIADRGHYGRSHGRDHQRERVRLYSRRLQEGHDHILETETETEWLVGQHQELEMSAAEVITDDVETKGMLAVVVVH